MIGQSRPAPTVAGFLTHKPLIRRMEAPGVTLLLSS
jgi:hypothetical protein